MKYFLPDGSYSYGFRFRQKYPNKQPWIKLGLAGKPHLGDDLICNGVQGIATLRGTGKYVYGDEGGHQLHFTPEGRNHLIRFMHMKSKASIKVGQISPGDKVFISDNTGASTTPHVHADIWNLDNGPLNINNVNGFLDPTTYNWIQQITPQIMTQKIIILTHKLVDLPFVKSWVDYAINWFSQTTNGEFKIEVTYVDKSNVNFTPINGVNASGVPVIYLDPQQVLDEAASLQDGSYSIVTLISEQNASNPKPTYDEAFSIIKHGLSVSEKFATQPAGDLLINASYLVHEWLHNWYFILNMQDDVHQHSTIIDPNPSANLSDVVLKLKPYWAQLTKKGDTMMVIKFTDSPTEYVLGDDLTLLGVVSVAAMVKTLKGRQKELKVLPPALRATFTIAESVVKE